MDDFDVPLGQGSSGAWQVENRFLVHSRNPQFSSDQKVGRAASSIPANGLIAPFGIAQPLSVIAPYFMACTGEGKRHIGI
ncbi:hypothetical protein [Sphingobium sp. sgz301304]|uniref:hypothetical protein n=1 Tax=Sphingobium sp. sgz301304 TaxID=3341828 RepID=UPI0035A6B528